MTSRPSTGPAAVDVLIIGAGFAGLYMLHKARQLGFRALILEAADDIGGVWCQNRYPGARCDIESIEYSYSFDDALQQEWTWSERYAAQPEILRYIHHVADRFDMRRDIVLDTRVSLLQYDEEDRTWRAEAGNGKRYRARFCVCAVGCLSSPTLPAYPGQEQFGGAVYHTGRWPREPVDFQGRRVAVFGTGSSGIQVIPEVARQASQLHVFQRTPSYCLPVRNTVPAPEEVRAVKRGYAGLRAAARESMLGIARIPPARQSALDVDAQEREHTYEQGWENGGSGYTRLYTDLLTDERANATAAGFVRNKIRAIVRDPEVAGKLVPDYPIGQRRLCLGTHYYETFNLDHVHLVDTRATPVQGFTAGGLRYGDTEIGLDAVIFATGFDAITGALMRIDIRNRQGYSLREKWQDGPMTYLGLMSAGFPNLFLVTGPGSPSVLSNAITAIEQHVEWIGECMAHMRGQGLGRIDADDEAERQWADQVAEAADRTLMAKGNSWYRGANVRDKPQVFMPYAGGMGPYRRICEQVACRGYDGFLLSD